DQSILLQEDWLPIKAARGNGIDQRLEPRLFAPKIRQRRQAAGRFKTGVEQQVAGLVEGKRLATRDPTVFFKKAGQTIEFQIQCRDAGKCTTTLVRNAAGRHRLTTYRVQIAIRPDTTPRHRRTRLGVPGLGVIGSRLRRVVIVRVFKLAAAVTHPEKTAALFAWREGVRLGPQPAASDGAIALGKIG